MGVSDHCYTKSDDLLAIRATGSMYDRCAEWGGVCGRKARGRKWVGQGKSQREGVICRYTERLTADPPEVTSPSASPAVCAATLVPRSYGWGPRPAECFISENGEINGDRSAVVQCQQYRFEG